MRVVLIGGTNFLGPVTVGLLQQAGHEVAVAHTGTHEHPAVRDLEHLHGEREELLAAGGQVERWRPDVLVDTFAGGATAEKAEATKRCAARASSQKIIAVSSIDVYQHCVEAGLADFSGVVPFPSQPLPLDEHAPLRSGPYPGGSAAHDNAAMEAALRDAGNVTVLRPGAIYGPGSLVREWFFVEKVQRGQRRLELPDGGGQYWHRVAVGRVGRAAAAALDHAPTAPGHATWWTPTTGASPGSPPALPSFSTGSGSSYACRSRTATILGRRLTPCSAPIIASGRPSASPSPNQRTRLQRH